MLLYLTSNQKSGLIDGAAHEMLMPSKKLVGKFSLKSFVTKDMRNYATAKFFLIDAACIEESGEDFTLALRSFQMMFLLRIPCFLCHVTLQQHLINIFIGVPLSALMNPTSTFSKNHSCNTIILSHHKVTFLANAHQLKINRIRSSSHRDHLTVIRL